MLVLEHTAPELVQGHLTISELLEHVKKTYVELDSGIQSIASLLNGRRSLGSHSSR